MLKLKDVRDYISGLVSDIADDGNVYSGKMTDKKDKSIGIYNQKRGQPAIKAIGDTSSYSVKPISLLVHWNTSQQETEAAAMRVYKLLADASGSIGGRRILFIDIPLEEPVDVGTDDNNIYEMVIEFNIYYERQVKV